MADDSSREPMLTPWGAAVTADNAWREYPRPQLVRDGWANLNGVWQYAIRARREPMPRPNPQLTPQQQQQPTQQLSQQLSRQWDGEILVPFCVESQLSGVARRVGPEDRLWYRRVFRPGSLEPRALLHFGAVDYHAAIWINGAYVGSHAGGFDAFTFDVSDFLCDGDNELVVAVDDPTNSADQPRGKQHLQPQGIWYTPVTGIWQTVWLESVPRANSITEVRCRADVSAAHVVVEVLLARPTRDPTLATSVTVRLGPRVVAQVLGRPDRSILVPIPAPALWSPQQPTLYDVEVALVRIPDPFAAAPTDPGSTATPSAGGARKPPLRGRQEGDLYASAGPVEAVLDTVRTYFGMRSIVVGPHPQSGQPALLLNGAPVFHLATLDQGWWPDGLHTPPADAALMYEIEFLKAAGFNAVRKHIKVEPARYYYHCDRLGLMVWQDMPSGFLPAQFIAPDDAAEGLRTSVSTAAYELELGRMIHRLCGHPSIVVWVLHNEGWGQFDRERLTAYIKLRDPSRPVNACSGWLDVGAGDFIDSHDYAADPRPRAGDGRRARIVGEYGGIGWPVAGHLWDPAMRNWGYQTLHDETQVRAAYARATAAIVAARLADGVCAAVYTQTSDVEGEVNGLVTYDRRVEKLSREWLAALHAGVRDA